MDYRSIILISGLLILLTGATAVVIYLRKRPMGIDSGTLSACLSRVSAQWLLFGALICASFLGTTAIVVLFGLISFWALREYITLTPTRPADHRTLVLVFFILTPLQFILVGIDSQWFSSFFKIEPYYIFSVLIPSFAFLILPATVATSGDPQFFLERIAKLQVGLLICVYSLSFAPALTTMNLKDVKTQPKGNEVARDIRAVNIEDRMIKPLEDAVGLQNVGREDVRTSDSSDAGEIKSVSEDVSSDVDQDNDKEASQESQDQTVLPHKRLKTQNILLLFVFVLLTQVNDMAQYFWSLAFPKQKIAVRVNSTKTTTGTLLGLLTTSLVAVALYYFTPFRNWRQAAIAGIIISTMGFAGNMTISAIKRDQGVGDYDDLVEGHSGALDRIDSLCFAAPVFFHYVRLCVN